MKRTLSIVLVLILCIALPVTVFAATASDLSAAEIYGDADTVEFLGWEIDGSTAKFLPTAGELALIPKIDASKSFTFSFNLNYDFIAMVAANANVKDASMIMKLRVPTESETYIQMRSKFGYKRDDSSAWNEWYIEPQYFDGSNWTDLSGGRNWISVSEPGTLTITISHVAFTEALTCAMVQGNVSVCNTTWDLNSSAWTAFTSFNGLEVDFNGDNAGSLAYSISNLALTVDGKNALTKTLYDVTVAAENGTVTGAGGYALDQTVTLAATAAAGYTFDGWYIGSEKVGSAAAYTLEVKGDTALTAKFIKNATEATTTSTTTRTTGSNSSTADVKTGQTAPVAAMIILTISGIIVYLSKKK